MVGGVGRVNSWLSTMPAMPMFEPVSRVTRGNGTEGTSSEFQQVKRSSLLFCYDTYGPCEKREVRKPQKVIITEELLASILEQINANKAQRFIKV